MKLENYEKTLDKTIDTVNTVYSLVRRIGYIILSIVFFIAGIALVGWGYMTVKNKLDGTNFVKAEGTVIRMREVPSNENSGVTWAPVIKFTDRAGKEHTFESTVSSDPPAYKVGEKVEVLYPEGKPEDVFINSFMEKWFTPIMLFFAGIVMLPFSVWMMFKAFRRDKPSSTDQNEGGSSQTYVSIG